MKRILTIALAVMLSATFIYGQEDRRDSNAGDFSGHWFIQVQGGMGYTVGETKFVDLLSPSAAFSFGYQFTPVWSLRAGLGGWQAKGAISGAEVYKYNFLQGNVDVMADICSIFSGYRMSREVSPYLFAGVGLNGAFNNDTASSLAMAFPSDNLIWDGSRLFPAGRFGAGTNIRITDAVQFNIEVNGNFLSDRFNSKRGSAVDWQFGAQVGVTFRIGLKKNRRHAAAEPVSVAPSDPVGAMQQEPQPRQPEPQVKEEPAPAAPVAVPEVKEYRDNVYFLIGKYCIRESESAKISAIAAMLKENPLAVVKITGYADAQTGTAGRNMYLSRKRAEAVAAAIIEAGISADRIRTEYKGSTEAPFGSPEENRVAVCVVSGQEQ